MKNKKKQFEALKNRLKNLYFKKSLEISKKYNAFKLMVERKPEQYNLEIEPKEKIKEKILFVHPQGLPKLQNKSKADKKSFNFATNKLKLFNPKVFNKTSNDKIINKNVIEKSIVFNNMVNETSNETKFINNKEKIEKIINNYSTKTKNIYSVNKEKNQQTKQILPVNNKKTKKSKEIPSVNNYYNTKIKFIDKPQDFKKIDPDQIENKVNFDLKTIYIPSKEEIINIKNFVTKNQNTKKSNTQKNINIINNFTTTKNINNTANNKKINSIDKTVYAIPAYYDGTGGPLKQDTIAKLHKNEIVLSEKQTKKLQNPSENIIKNENTQDLKPVQKIETNQNQKSTEKEKISSIQNIDSEKQKNSDLKGFITDDLTNIMKMNQSNEPTVIDKQLTSIDQNLRKPLFLDLEPKNKSLPVWRATIG